MKDGIIKKIKKNNNIYKYEINNKIYHDTYNLNLMDQKILYELNTSVPYISKINLNIHKFVYSILFERIDKLYLFLHYMNFKYINKLRLYLCEYFCKVINGVGIKKKKHIFINELCQMIFKKLAIIEFTSVFTKSEFFDILNNYCKKIE